MNLRRTLKDYSFFCLAFVYLVSRFFHSEVYWVIPAEYFLFLHTLLEFFSIIVSFTIALQCFASYPYTMSDRKYFLGIVFISVGLFDLMHVLMYKGMFFNTTGARATYFWLFARIAEASGLLIYILNRAPKRKHSLSLGFISALVVLIGVMKWGPSFPRLLNSDGGVTSLKVAIEYFICSLQLISLLMLLHRSLIEKREHHSDLIKALLIIFVSELFFTVYQDVYDLDNLLGHFFKFWGYVFILKSILVKNLHEPFQKIEMSLAHLNTIFEFAPVGLTIIRKSDYQILEGNNCFRRYLGLSEKGIIGKTPFEVGLSETDWPKIIAYANSKNSCAVTPPSYLEIPVVINDHTIRIAAISAESIELDREECILMSMTDITELNRLHAEMTRLDRLNLVGQMAAGIAHEIRNPMTTVRGYLQLMGEKSQNTGQKSIISFMIEELDRANSIIKEYLTLAKSHEVTYQSLNLNNMLQNLYPLIEADSFTQNKQIKFDPGKIPDIEINSKEITQLVLNLCRNALDAMLEGGCLRIQTYVKDQNVVLSVKDEGHGIPKELLEKLGTPFFTTKENGTGLGLAICYSIAQSHQARIDVNSNSNGTEFLVSFPIQSTATSKDN